MSGDEVSDPMVGQTEIVDCGTPSSSGPKPGTELVPRTADLIVMATGFIAALPFLFALRFWASDYFPVQDLAVVNLRLRDVFTPDTPLLGAYSQFRWNHPGPVMYWMLTPFMVIARGHAWGMIVGAAMIQAGAIVATIVVARRSAGPVWAVAWALLAGLAYAGTGPWMVVEAWNPHLAYPIFVLFLLLVWRCATEPASYAVWVVVTGTVLVQLHVGYAPLVAVPGLWLVWLIWRSTHQGKLVELRRIFVQSGVAAAILWSFPVFEALTNRGGNFRALINYFLIQDQSEFRAGPLTAARVLGSSFRIVPPWLGGPTDIDPFTGTTPGSSLFWLVIPACLVVLGLIIYPRCEVQYRRLLMLSWLMLGSGAIALTLLRGKVAPYLFYWRDVCALLVVLAVAASVLSLIPQPSHPIRAGFMSIMTAVLLIHSVIFAAQVARVPSYLAPFSEPTRELVDQVTRVDGPTIIRWVGSPLGGTQAGVINELSRRGEPVGVDVGDGFQWGDHREIPLRRAAQIWYVSEKGYPTAYLEGLRGARVVALSSPLAAQEERELASLQLQAADQLKVMGREDVISQLDSPLASIELDRLGVLDTAVRQRLFQLTEKVEESGKPRLAIIAFDTDNAPTIKELAGLR